MLGANAATATVTPSSRRWILLGFLTAAMFFCYAHRQTLAIAAPYMMKDLGLNQAAIGILLSSFFWSYSLAQVPAGWLIDRYGLPSVYAIGFFIWTSAVMLTSVPSTMSGLIAIQLLLGLGQGVPFPASARAVANWFPSGERGGATGVYLSGNRLGQAAIAGIGPTLIVALGWRSFFVITGLAGLIWLAAWLFTFRSWRIGPTSNGAPTTQTKLSLAESLPLLRNRRILGIFLGFFAYDYAWFLLLRWLPVYLSIERKFDRHEMALANSIPYVLVVFLVIPAGMAADFFVRKGWNEIRVRKSFISLGLLLGSLMVPATFVQSKAACSWLLAAAVCGLGCAAPNAWLLTEAVCPKQLVGTASGIQNLGGNIAGVIVPAVTGFIAQRTGQSVWAFSLAGLILLGGIASYWFLIPDTSTVGSMQANEKGFDAA